MKGLKVMGYGHSPGLLTTRCDYVRYVWNKFDKGVNFFIFIMTSISIPRQQKAGGVSGQAYPFSSSLLDEKTILVDLRRHLDDGKASNSDGKQTVAIPVAAIQALLDVIRRSEANTMMGLQMELQEASNIMLSHAMGTDSTISESHENSGISLLGGRSIIPLASGCELFLKYVTRAFLELPDFKECRAQVLERGERFASISLAARERIADLGQAFIQDGMVVLTHGSSRVVTTLLLKAARAGKHFEIIVLEGRPDAGGAKAAKQFVEKGIPTSVILDSAMGYVMERVDMVLVGAEGEIGPFFLDFPSWLEYVFFIYTVEILIIHHRSG
jgi:translation initiation factor 2B subunit (eIF-2B alpha/beta/delta family)